MFSALDVSFIEHQKYNLWMGKNTAKNQAYFGLKCQLPDTLKNKSFCVEKSILYIFLANTWVIITETINWEHSVMQSGMRMGQNEKFGRLCGQRKNAIIKGLWWRW